MSEESAIRVDRIKKILGLDSDGELAGLCGAHASRVSGWRNNGFPMSTGKLLDALMDRYDQDKRPRVGRPPKLSIGQRIQRARKDQRLSQRDLTERMYGNEGLSDNALRMRGTRLEKLETIDDETLERVSEALGISKDDL